MNTNLTLPIRQALIGLGPLLAYMGVTDEASWLALSNHLAVVLGVAWMVGGVIWQWWVSRPAAKVAQVAALPGVIGVVTNDPNLAAAADAGSRANKVP
ncbi:hypothetical protein GCM10019059_07860 [Camelimonas fluminis]|uniref:Holin n=1 Tax=Camelimonas fluminis TaxID=1576911 RepID=A0ABV7UF59_9HYPH|nr:hypothetical protein [Camelimonas fluminis]GHE51080.1 hypothetical protein GCM10019059_07860 [Camelimonas fluminis]